MKQVKYYIKDILEIISHKLEEQKIGDKIYAEHRPIGIGEQLDSMSVVMLPVEFVDNGAYQKTNVHFQLIARNRMGGISPTDILQEMLDKLITLFPIIEERFTITSPQILLKGDGGNGFSVWIVQASMIINTTDRL